MRTTVLTLFGVLFFFSLGLKAQKKTNKIKTHKAWVTLVDGSKAKGILYSADNEGIKITSQNSFDATNLITINAKNISVLKIRKKGKVGKGALIGGLSGVGFSLLIGATTNDGFFTKEEAATLTGIIFVPLGTGIGALVGTKKETIYIFGKSESYKTKLEIIKRYTLPLN
ncbi:hypothetical protein JYT76_03780 [Olleya sp. AH-315-F22]|nr:hypothetical protein [Olleya sp. AH-315-F22]